MQKLTNEENVALGAVVEYLQRFGLKESQQVLSRELKERRVELDVKSYIAFAKNYLAQEKNLQDEMVLALIQNPELRKENVRIGADILAAQRKIQELREEKKALEEQRQKKQREMEQAYQQFDAFKNTFAENTRNLKEKYRQLQLQYAEVDAERSSAVQKSQDSANALKEAQRRAEMQEEVYRARVVELQGRVESLESVVTNLEGGAQRSAEQAVTQAAALNQARKESQELAQALSQARRQVEEQSVELEKERQNSLAKQQQLLSRLQAEGNEQAARQKAELQGVAEQYNQQLEAARKQYNAYLAALTEKLDSAETTLQESRDLVQQLIAEREGLQSQVKSLQTALQKQQEQAGELAQALRALTQRAERAERAERVAGEQLLGAQKQQEEETQRRQSFEREAGDLRKESEELQREAEELRRKLAQEMSRREQSRSDQGDVQAALQKQRSDAQQLREEVQQAQILRQRIEGELQASVQHKTQLQTELIQVKGELQRSQAESAGLQHRLEMQEQSAKALALRVESQVQGLRAQVQEAQTHADGQVQGLQAQIQQLQVQNAQLSQQNRQQSQQLQQTQAQNSQLSQQLQQQSQQSSFNTSLAGPPFQSVAQQSLRQQLEEAEQEVARLQAKQDAQKRRILELEERISELEVANAKATATHTAMELAHQQHIAAKEQHFAQLLADAEREQSRLVAEGQRTAGEAAQAKAAVEALQKQNAALQSQIEKFRQEVTQTTQNFSADRQLILTDLDESSGDKTAQKDKELLQTLRVQRKVISNQAKNKVSDGTQTEPDEEAQRFIDSIQTELQMQRALVGQQKLTIQQLESDICLREEEKEHLLQELHRAEIQTDARAQRLTIEQESWQSRARDLSANAAALQSEIEQLKQEIANGALFQDEQAKYIVQLEALQGDACTAVEQGLLTFMNGFVQEPLACPETLSDLGCFMQTLQNTVLPKVEERLLAATYYEQTKTHIGQLLADANVADNGSLVDTVDFLIKQAAAAGAQVGESECAVAQLRHDLESANSEMQMLRDGNAALEQQLVQNATALELSYAMQAESRKAILGLEEIKALSESLCQQVDAKAKAFSAKIDVLEKALDVRKNQLKLLEAKRINDETLRLADEKAAQEAREQLEEELAACKQRIQELTMLTSQSAVHIRSAEAELLQAQHDKDVIQELTDLNQQLQQNQDHLRQIAQEQIDISSALKQRVVELEQQLQNDDSAAQFKQFEAVVERMRQEIIQLRAALVSQEDEKERLKLMVQRQQRDFDKQINELSSRKWQK